MYNRCFILLVFPLILIMGCRNDFNYKVPLSDIETVTIPKQKYAHGVILKIKGHLNCKVDLIMMIDGREYGSKLQFVGDVDTIIKRDWYYNDLSFKLLNEPCDMKNAIAEIELLTMK